jgi:hypothetical protein
MLSPLTAPSANVLATSNGIVPFTVEARDEQFARPSGSAAAPAIAWTPRSIQARFLVAVLYFLVAAASYNGYFTKWQMRDSDQAFSLAAVLDGTAQRPWVYRQLMPALANGVEHALPPDVRAAVLRVILKDDGSTVTKIDTPLARDARYTLRYHGVFYLTFLLFFVALFVLRTVCIQVTGDVLAGTLAPLCFAVLMPVLLTIGGYYYDFVELLFMAAAVWATLNRRWMVLAILTVAATTNKEAFFFFAIGLYPLVRVHLDRRRAAILTAGLVTIALLTYLPLRAVYATNPGASAVYQLGRNLAFYANPLNLLKLESTYSIVMLKGYNPIVILALALVIKDGWRGLAPHWRQHFVWTAAINFPLLLLYCAPGEMRNLSLCYVGLIVILATAISRWISELAPPKGSALLTV